MKLLKGFKSAPSPQNTRVIPGGVFNFLAMGYETQGRHALMRIVVGRGAEPPAHVHSSEDESYFILKGGICYTVGEEIITARDGDYVFLPKGIPHKFEVLTDHAEVLMLISPAGLDQWFWDNSTPAPDGKPLPIPQGPPPDHVMDHFVRSLREYGVEMI